MSDYVIRDFNVQPNLSSLSEWASQTICRINFNQIM